MMKRSPLALLLLAGLLVALGAGCELDVTNPNAATAEDVLSDPNGIRNLAVGMQGFYNDDVLDDVVLNPGVTTREVAINTTFASLIELETGGTSLPPANSRTNGVWNGLVRTMDMAEQLLDEAPNVIVDPGELSGILALARVYKAMSLGFLAQSFTHAPLNTGADAAFSPRQEVLAEAIRLLESAFQQITTTPPSDAFNDNILLDGFDMVNTIHALQARYHLIAGNFQAALDAANRVDLAATSVFTYDGSTLRNPIFSGVVSGDEGQEYAPRDNFGTDLTEAGDRRLDFYLVPLDEQSNPNGLPIDGLAGFFERAGSPLPVYLPGEMYLIRAEAHLRLGRADDAIAQINAVRTKTAAGDPFGLGAELPPYSGPTDEQSLLTEIYRQRAAELYLTGLRLEDSRRLGRPDPPMVGMVPLDVERNRNFYPFPTQERQNNPGTPSDPPI